MSTHDCKAFGCIVGQRIHYNSDGSLMGGARTTVEGQHDCGNPECHLRYTLTEPKEPVAIAEHWGVRWDENPASVVAYNSREYAEEVLSIRKEMGETGTLVKRVVSMTAWSDV